MAGEEKPSGKPKVDEPVTEEDSTWLDAHYDPVASLNTLTSCMVLEDLSSDGDHKLLVGDFGSGTFDAKIKVYGGTRLVTELQLLDLPTAVCTFYIDTTEPHTPVVAVASGSLIYIFKNMRPYFKFNLPTLEVNQKEKELWMLAKQERMDPVELYEQLGTLKENNSEGVPLTVRTHRLLNLSLEDALSFVSVFKHSPLKRDTVVTSMTTLQKDRSGSGAVSCLLVTTENREIFIFDPQAFTILVKMTVPAVPVFISASGLCDVQYTISVACRDAFVYTFKKGNNAPKYQFAPGAQSCGLVRVGKNLIIGLANKTLVCYTPRGKHLWSVGLPDLITTMALMDYQSKMYQAVLVSLKNCEVRIYKDKYLVNTIKTDDIAVGLQFGQFGREDGVLTMVTQNGCLIVKILKRTVMFEEKDPIPGPPHAQSTKLNIPKKTKLFASGTLRERETGAEMHRLFQKDLFSLKLDTARSYVRSLATSMVPMTTSQGASYKISAQVQGIGPLFQLTVGVEAMSRQQSATNLCLVFRWDETLYSLSKKIIQVPILIPSISYSFNNTVECLDDSGRSDLIKVFLHFHGNPVPLVTANIDMPISESVVFV